MSAPRDTGENNAESKSSKKKVRFTPYEDREPPPYVPEETGEGDEMAEAAAATEPQATAHVHVDMESPVTPQNQTEAAILVCDEDKYWSRFWIDCCWYFGVALLFFFLTACIFMAIAPEPRRQRVIVQVPEDSGVVTVATPGRSAWDQPQVVAVYRKPKKEAKVLVHEHVIVKKGTEKTPEPKVVKREIPV
jgi:hypothetical protein